MASSSTPADDISGIARLQTEAGTEPSATESAESLFDSVVDALPRLGVALTLVASGYVLSRVVRWSLHRAMRDRRTPSFSRVMSKVGGWILMILAVLAASVVAFPSVKPVDLLAGLGIFSVAIGFAFQDILENTLSGVLLLFRQPFATGDEIRVVDQAGTVEAITIRETRITTFDGQLVVIPNRDVYKNVITVQTHYPKRRLSFTVGVAYENDAGEACAVIRSALADLAGVDQVRRPEASVTRLGESTVEIEARYWTEPTQHDAVRMVDEGTRATKQALEAAGIDIPAPIVSLRATPSLRAALHGDDGGLTPDGGVPTPG